jgi:uncharacterized protein YfaS (alpha-2-macroglobulin family)
MKRVYLLARIIVFASIAAAVPTLATYFALAQEGDQDTGPGLHFRLSEITPTGPRPSAAPTPAIIAAKLSDRETERLLSRLPAMSTRADDQVDFKLRERSLPPPIVGKIIEAAFTSKPSGPPPVTATTTTPLRVLRFAPDGEVKLAPGFSITFSLPMISVASQEEAASVVPVTLSPQPKGKWRWLGTQTLVFEPDYEGGRMPMATDYTVTVPAGTRSALGNVLAAAQSFKFATPPVALTQSYPNGESNPHDALMYLGFDQRIDPARMLEHLQLRPANQSIHLRLATPAEIESSDAMRSWAKESQPGRWMIVRAVNEKGETKDVLPADTMITLAIPPGSPSAEGGRGTAKEQNFSFKTYGPLRLKEAKCYYDGTCYALTPVQVRLTNPLDPAAFKTSQVAIKPEIPGVKIALYGDMLTFEGPKISNTTYTVTLDRAVKDIFGQTLVDDNSISFRVKPMPPRLFSMNQGFVVLDPAVKRTFTVYSINLPQIRVRLSRLEPEDWPIFRSYEAARRTREKDQPPHPGKVVFDQVLELPKKTDELTESAIDLSPALTSGYGQVLVEIDPVSPKSAPLPVYANREDNPIVSWVQATDIGLDAFADNTRLVVWTNALKDGAPLANVDIRVLGDGLAGATSANGLAQLPFDSALAAKSTNEFALIVARRGDDVAILPPSYYPYYYNNSERSWRRSSSTESLSWYVFDDRKLYRPGEEVHIKGWIRNVHTTPTGDTEMFHAEPKETVNYILRDPLGNEVLKGTAPLNALAGFDFKLQLPPTMNLGWAELHFKLEEAGTSYDHRFQVQEFRRPEFEVKAELSEGPFFIGSHATATMNAVYYTGGGLANTEVNWNVVATPTNYTPPNRDDYTFGKFVPWWYYAAEYGETVTKAFKGTTNAEGQHILRMDFDSVSPARPSSVTAEARVQDVNRQTLAARATMLVHPADVYVGLKSARTFVQKGEAFEISTIVTDLDGNALVGRPVKMRLIRLDYDFENGSWVQKLVDPQEQTVSSAAAPVIVRFPVAEGGTYRLVAQVRDDRERLNETEMSLWVAGGKTPPNRELAQDKVELIPSKRTYNGGEVAEVLVQSPFAPAEGTLTLRRSGLLRTERFTMTGNSHTLRIPIETAMMPNIHVQVDLVGSKVRSGEAGKLRTDLPHQTAYATGEINLAIPVDSRRLTVTATPRDGALEPGAETTVAIQVKDAQGRPTAGAETAVVVVDEAVLALANYEFRDPLSIFYAERNADVGDYHLRERVRLADPREVEAFANRFSADGVNISTEQISSLPLNGRNPAALVLLAPGAMKQSANEISATVDVTASAPESQVTLRKNFNALAVFAAAVPTDAQGRAVVRVKMPDNLTRYRVMAVAVSGGQLAGKGESVITARKELMARPSAPRFLNFGDRAELPVVLQNQSGKPLLVNLAVRATNAELTDGGGRSVTVPANDRVEVRFPLAAMMPGLARFQIVTESGALNDASEIFLPVYTPATTEAFATYGVLDRGNIAQPVQAPKDAVRSFGGLEVTTASTQLQELTDAFVYLYNYPFGCNEQIASRMLAIVALKDVLAAFKVKDFPSPETLRADVESDIKHLQGLQNEDGGFEYWVRGEKSVPWVSIHVAHALARAKKQGFTVPEKMIEEAKDYLDDIDDDLPKEYSIDSRRVIRSYALYVRYLLGDPDPSEAEWVIDEAKGPDKLPLEALGWLLPVLDTDREDRAETIEAIRRHIGNRATETAGAAHFADSYTDGAYTTLNSGRRADGVLLEALIGDQPQNDLIPKLVRGLLSGRTAGRWSSTQENVFILLALDRYFQTYEKTEPDFTARVWLGNTYGGQQVFKGRSVDKQQLNLPMAALADRTKRGPANLTIAKEGAGRLYYRIGTKYAPANLNLAAANYGFQVERVYEAIDNPADVRRDADGIWHIKSGTRIRVRLRMSNPARRYHVALVDPLPAGLEVLNPELAGTETVPADNGSDDDQAKGGFAWFWQGRWFEHQNMRDDRVEAFTQLLWEGEHVYTYVARATTPGLFVVPPSKAEEMYAPETFGRGHSDKVRIE